MNARALQAANARNEWLTLAVIAAIGAAVAVLYAPTLSRIVELWGNSAYRHGALALPLSAYLLWRLRAQIAAVRFVPWWPGVLLVALLVVGWWFARALDVDVVEQLAAVALIPATVTALLGLALVKRALFPLVLLVAAVPVGDGLLPMLMRVTADISTALLRISGVPVFREGQFLNLPGGTFEVAEVCSGLNYLVSGLMVGMLFAYFTYRSNVKRAVFVAVMAAALVLANGLRAFIVMYVASATQLEYMAGRDHVWFGWLLFGVVVVGLFVVGARWADHDVDTDADAATGGAASDTVQRAPMRRDVLPLALVLVLVLLAATAQRFEADLGSSWKLLLPIGGILIWVLAKRSNVPVTSRVGGGESAPPRSKLGAGLTIGIVAALLCAGPWLAAEPDRAMPRNAAAVALPIVSGCEEPSQERASRSTALPAADYSATALYRCVRGEVAVSVAGYWGAGAQRETHLLVPPVWRTTPATETLVALPDGSELAVNDLLLPGRRAWYWYRIGGRNTVSAVETKLLLALEMLRTDAPTAAVFLVEAATDVSAEADTHALAQVAAALVELPLPEAAASDRVVNGAGGGQASDASEDPTDLHYGHPPSPPAPRSNDRVSGSR